MSRPRAHPDTPDREKRREWSRAWYQRHRDEITHFEFSILKYDYAELKDMAKVKGSSISELVRTYITWGLETDAADIKTHNSGLHPRRDA